MKKNFTLFASLLLALSMNAFAADINIDPSTNLATAYSGAASGDVIILADGSYTVDATINLTKGITIKAQNPLQATVVGTGFIFNTAGISDVTIQGLVFNGTKTTDGVMQLYFTDINGGTTLNNVTIENCKVMNYGNCILRANRAEGTVKDFVVNNCVFKNIGASNAYPFFQLAKTKITNLKLTNSTIADLSNEYIQNYSTTAGGNNDGTFLFKNNTFYNTVTNAARKPFNFASGKVYVQNNIFVKSTTGTRTTDVVINAAVTTAEFTNNVVNDYDAGALLNSTGWSVNTGNLDVVPGFLDATNYDFTLPTGSALITANIGDPRWMGISAAISSSKSNDINITVTEGKIQLSEAANVEIINISGKAIKSATDVQTISTVDLSSGIYIVKATNATGSKIQKVVIK